MFTACTGYKDTITMNIEPNPRPNTADIVIREQSVSEPSRTAVKPGRWPCISRLLRAAFRFKNPGRGRSPKANHARSPALPSLTDALIAKGYLTIEAEDSTTQSDRSRVWPSLSQSRSSSIGAKNISTAQAALNSCRLKAYHKGFGLRIGFPQISTSGRLLQMRTIVRTTGASRVPRARKKKKYQSSPLGPGLPRRTNGTQTYMLKWAGVAQEGAL